MSNQDQLYVKLEGHEDLNRELYSVNQIVENIEEATELLDEIRGIKSKTIQNIRENVLELNQRIEDIHGEMPNVEDQNFSADISPDAVQEQEAEEIDESVNQLHNQLETLKSELEELE